MEAKMSNKQRQYWRKEGLEWERVQHLLTEKLEENDARKAEHVSQLPNLGSN